MIADRNMDIQRRESLRLFVVLGTVMEGMGKSAQNLPGYPTF
jgi:hypothetical protein